MGLGHLCRRRLLPGVAIPSISLVLGLGPWKGHALLLRARRSDFRFPTDAPKVALLLCWHECVWRAVEVSVGHEEIPDADHESVIGRVCAIDVAKAAGKVCVRVPHPTLEGRRVSRVWDVPSTLAAVTE